MLDYRLVEAFAAVLEERGFERAAERLCITQPAVSHRIKQLEDEVGRALIIRETPPRATPAGERLLRHYRQVESLEVETIGDLGLNRRTEYQHLPIAANADTLAVWLLEAIYPLLKRRSIALEILVDDQDRTLRFLKTGEVAGCISAEKASIQGFTCTRIGEMDHVLAASPPFIGTWFPAGFDRDAAMRAPIVNFSRYDQLQYKALLRLFGKPQVTPPEYFIPATDKFIDMIVEGLAYGLIPEVQAAPMIADGTLTEIDARARLKTTLYWYRWNRPSALLEELTDMILAEGGRILGSAREP